MNHTPCPACLAHPGWRTELDSRKPRGRYCPGCLGTGTACATLSWAARTEICQRCDQIARDYAVEWEA